MESSVKPDSGNEPVNRISVVENGITITQSNGKKTPGKYNPKLSIFREFALATAHVYAEEHRAKQSDTSDGDSAGAPEKRQYFACDLVSQSGIAGLQWKRHIGKDVHVTLVEQRDPQLLEDNIQANNLTVCSLPLDPKCPAGTHLPHQASTEVHLAQCDPSVLMQLEAFDFVYVDPYKNPVSYFSSVFRNVRKNGVMCIVVSDTMQFARSPHVVRRYYSAHCMKTEYLKELAVRIILATLVTEAARCNKGMSVLYAVSLDDFLLLCVQVRQGPKLADSSLLNLGHVLHCRICEERAFYPDSMAPVEYPYNMISCDCHKNVPGKTGVILGPVWKGSMYDYSCLTKLAVSGRALHLSPAFFTLLHRVMEDCLCDTPPSVYSLQNGQSDDSPPQPSPHNNCDTTHTDNGSKEESADSLKDRAPDGSVGHSAVNNCSKQECKDSSEHMEKEKNSVSGCDCLTSDSAEERKCIIPKDAAVSDTCVKGSTGVKRTASEAEVQESSLNHKRLKSDMEPAPCFFYNIHSKRLAKNHLPKHRAIVERVRAHGYRCCRTHFEKYAIRTNANLKTLTTLLGSGESKVLFVKGSQNS